VSRAVGECDRDVSLKTRSNGKLKPALGRLYDVFSVGQGCTQGIATGKRLRDLPLALKRSTIRAMRQLEQNSCLNRNSPAARSPRPARGRSRGEDEIRASEFRVRGSLRELTSIEFAEAAPHPTFSP
jgi:hypothetical protein